MPQQSPYFIFLLASLSIIALVTITFFSLDNTLQSSNSITGNPIKELPPGKQHGFGGITRNALNPLPAKITVSLSDAVPANPSINDADAEDCPCGIGQVLTAVTFHNAEQGMRGMTLSCSKLQNSGNLGINFEKHCNLRKPGILEKEKTLSCSQGAYLYRTRFCLNDKKHIVGIEGWCMQPMIVENKLTYKGAMLEPVSFDDCATWSSWKGGRYAEPLVGFSFTNDDAGFTTLYGYKVGLRSSLVS